MSAVGWSSATLRCLFSCYFFGSVLALDCTPDMQSAVDAAAMPSSRYQHGAVFVAGRLHISGGAVGGGRMVEDETVGVVLDTAAGCWCPLESQPAAGDDWMRR